jgi:hypothetical protein
MESDVFRTVCERLGYPAGSVWSIRINREQIVVVTRSGSGQLKVINHDGNGRAIPGEPEPVRGLLGTGPGQLSKPGAGTGA